MLTDEQAKAVKEQILKQAENFPEDKREQIKQYILGMNKEELEEFLRKNKQMQEDAEEKGGKNEKCVMCLISSKKMDSVHIYEDNDYLAVLEINPLSKGHAMLIPKKHVSSSKELPKSAEKTAKKVSKAIIKKMKADDVKIYASDELGHAVVNIIPVYKNEELGKRKPAKKEELLEIKNKIGEIKKTKPKKEPSEKKQEPSVKELVKEIIKLPRRIP